MFKRKLTEVAVDGFTDYLQEKFARLKQFDLDQDGQKDVDQIIEIVGRVAVKAKSTINSTDFGNIASGLEHVLQGANMIRNSLDQEKLAELGTELSAATKQLSILGQLTIKYVKENDTKVRDL